MIFWCAVHSYTHAPGLITSYRTGPIASSITLLQVHRLKLNSRHRNADLRVQAAVSDLVGVLLFSAFPFVSVQALADSDFGKKLQVELSVSDVRVSALQPTDLIESGSFSLRVPVSHMAQLLPCRSVWRTRSQNSNSKSEERPKRWPEPVNRGASPVLSLIQVLKSPEAGRSRGVVSGLINAWSTHHIPESPKWLELLLAAREP